MPVKPLYKSPNAKIHLVRTPDMDLDIGGGTTEDYVLLRHPKKVTLRAARLVYNHATSGTVAAGSVALGTTVGGVDIVAAVNYGNAQAVGTKTALTLLVTTMDADTVVYVRHTGVAATQAGKAYIELEYEVWDD